MPVLYKSPIDISGIDSEWKFAEPHAANSLCYKYEGPDDPSLRHWFHKHCVENPHEMIFRFHGPENHHFYCYWGIYLPEHGELITNYWLGFGRKKPVDFPDGIQTSETQN